MFTHSRVYFMTSLRQVSLYSATEIFLPMSSLWIPSFFSTPISTGSPWVSQPARRATRYPVWVLYRQIASLMERAMTWWIPGMPLADGGPSKKMNSGAPSRTSRDFSKAWFFFHLSRISAPTFTRSNPLYSLNVIFFCLILHSINCEIF